MQEGIQPVCKSMDRPLACECNHDMQNYCSSCPGKRHHNCHKTLKRGCQILIQIKAVNSFETLCLKYIPMITTALGNGHNGRHMPYGHNTNATTVCMCGIPTEQPILPDINNLVPFFRLFQRNQMSQIDLFLCNIKKQTNQPPKKSVQIELVHQDRFLVS